MDEEGEAEDIEIKEQYMEDKKIPSFAVDLVEENYDDNANDIKPMDAIAVPYKSGGGMDYDDFITDHAYDRHAYDPTITSTASRTLYGLNVDVAQARTITLNYADSVVDLGSSTRYSLQFDPDYNLSTSDTPTAQHRVLINLNDYTRSTQFPRYPSN